MIIERFYYKDKIPYKYVNKSEIVFKILQFIYFGNLNRLSILRCLSISLRFPFLHVNIIQPISLVCHNNFYVLSYFMQSLTTFNNFNRLSSVFTRFLASFSNLSGTFVLHTQQHINQS